MSAYIESKNQERVRPAAMGHFYASLERNRHLGELLGKSLRTNSRPLKKFWQYTKSPCKNSEAQED